MMLYTNDLLVTPNLGTPTLGRAGTAAGTSSAAAAGASFTATVRTGQAVGVGQALEIDETMVALPDRVDTSPPAAAERLLCYLLPRTKREDILGDLEETIEPASSPSTARGRRGACTGRTSSGRLRGPYRLGFCGIR